MFHPPSGSTALYLTIAGLCLVVALRFVRRALQPVGAILQAAAAAAVVAFALGVAVVLLLAAAFIH